MCFISQELLYLSGLRNLPVLLLFFWLVRTAIKTPDIFKDLYGQPLLLGLIYYPCLS